MPRVVLDTNAWLDLLVFEDPRISALRAALHAARLQACTNDACREEWRRVLGYPLLALDEARQHVLMQAFDRLAGRHGMDGADGTDGPSLPRCSDPDDQKFLELSLACQARWLVTRDKALLRLNRKTLRDHGFGILVPEAWSPDLPPGQSSKR